MDFVNLPLFAVSALVFVSVLTGLFSARIGFSFLLVFLLAGILAGEDGFGGYRFDDFRLGFWVGNVALAIILLDGGLRTAFSTFRTGLKPAFLLATLGVAVCALLTALAGVLFVGLDWHAALLLGAIVGSTDAAAVFALLTRSGVSLNERVAATLEIESGVNDPMAVYLTLSFIALATLTTPGPGFMWTTLAWSFVQQFGWGTLLGLGSGFAMAALLKKVSGKDAVGGILALLLCAGGLAVFASTGLIGGSGFLAVYLFGLIVANRASAAVTPALAAMDGYAWLAQAGMFLLLGLLVTPSSLLPSLLPALAVALTLMFIARPVAVWLCLAPLRFTARETWFISWVGLRGAVPIVLALFPLLAGLPQAHLLFNVAFVVVLVSLLLQGSTIGAVARWLGVALPDPGDEAQVRAVFGDFALDPAMPVGPLCAFYGLPAPPEISQALGDWMAGELGRPAIAGDRVRLGSATLIVRKLIAGRISSVGLSLDE
ncbi:MAG: potassium/proton antiporter [Rhodoferax sp.]|uniref:potassium/proton antiporter n=1 Tax=Rhodoferax sp. TaxID=50421 RepID=UPI0013FE810C|nr:potassium/proton antiporter [Rhodoferax sp.]NDP37579.1 potassium/proton antiporter [Rhodoferax sp.]